MPLPLPDELVDSISKQWPCRQLQTRQLANLLHPAVPSFPSIVVHGPEASGKSSVIRAVLDAYSQPETQTNRVPTTNSKHKRRKVEKDDGDSISTNDDSLRYCVVKVAECITARHLLTKIVSSAIASTRPADEDSAANKDWVGDAYNARCEHVSSLPGVLGEILRKARCRKFVLVLDEPDEMREGGQMLLAALARIGESVPALSVVFTMKLTPRPLLLQVTGVPHVHFPPYSRDEAIFILETTGAPVVEGLSSEAAERLFSPFLSALYDSLIGPTAATIQTGKSVCRNLWPRFVMPIVNGERPPGSGKNAQWDFSRLLVKNRGLFQQQGELALIHRITTSNSMFADGGSSALSRVTSPLPSLPYLSILILAAAFLAGHTPPRMDVTFFSKFTSTKNKRIRRRKRRAQTPEAADDFTATPGKDAKKSATKSNAVTSSTPSRSLGREPTSGLLNPRPFTLERLLAICHAIDPNPPLTKSIPLADAVYPELATLQRLRMLVPASAASAATGGAMDGAEKWCLNINVTVGAGASLSGEWVVELAKGIGVDIEEYVAGLMA